MNRISYDPLNYSIGGIYIKAACRELAKNDRDIKYRALKAEGKNVKRSVLTGQLRKWEALGIADGRTRDIFEITVFE